MKNLKDSGFALNTLKFSLQSEYICSFEGKTICTVGYLTGVKLCLNISFNQASISRGLVVDSWAEVASSADVAIWVMDEVIWLPASRGQVVLFHLLALGG